MTSAPKTPRRTLQGLLAGVLAACLVMPALGPSPAYAEDARDPVDPSGAQEDLEQAQQYIKRSKNVNNSEITEYLKVIVNAYGNFAVPPKPSDEDGPDALKEWEKQVAKIEREQAKFDKDVEKTLFKALTMKDVKNDTNQRDDVNAAAAELIGSLAPYLDEDKRGKLTKSLTKAIEGLDKADWAASFVLERMFLAVAQLNHTDGVEWMLDNYVHEKARPQDVMRLQAAHKAMVHFKNVPGKLRYAVVDEFIKVYAGTEATANQSKSDPATVSKREFWDAIKVDAIAVLQHFAGNPENEEGQVPNTVDGFQKWFRDNDNVRKAPWVDPDVDG